jgi:hypothetical protein
MVGCANCEEEEGGRLAAHPLNLKVIHETIVLIYLEEKKIVLGWSSAFSWRRSSPELPPKRVL